MGSSQSMKSRALIGKEEEKLQVKFDSYFRLMWNIVCFGKVIPKINRHGNLNNTWRMCNTWVSEFERKIKERDPSKPKWDSSTTTFSPHPQKIKGRHSFSPRAKKKEILPKNYQEDYQNILRMVSMKSKTKLFKLKQQGSLLLEADLRSIESRKS